MARKPRVHLSGALYHATCMPTRQVSPWGIWLTKEQRSERKSVWEENEFFLEGHHEYLTIISFYIVNKRAEFKKKEGLPSFLLVELPLKVGKKLAITAAWEIEQGLKTDVENALKRTPLEKKIMGLIRNASQA